MEERFKNIKNEIIQKINNLNEKYNLYSHATIRGIIVERDDIYKNIFSSIMLEPYGEKRIPDKMENIIPSELIYFQRSIEFTQLDQILEVLLSEEHLILDDKIIKLKNPNDSFCQWYDRDDKRTRESEYHFGISHGISTYFIRGGYQKHQLTLNIKPLEIYGLDNIDKIVWKYVFNKHDGFPRNFSTKSDCGIFIIIPNYHGELEKVEIIEKNIRIKVESWKNIVPLSDLALTLEIKRPDYSTISPIIINPIENNIIEEEVGEDIGNVEAYLWWNKGSSEAEHFIDKKYGERPVYVKRNLLDSHKRFDSDFKILEGSFSSSDSDDFEWSIATLMHLCGFQVEWLGYMGGKFRKGEIDILAFLPNYLNIIAIECTISLGDLQRKVQNLYVKIDQLRKEINNNNILGVIFTNCDESSLSGEVREIGSKQGIAIISHDKIKELFSLAKSASPALEIFEEITGEIHKR